MERRSLLRPLGFIALTLAAILALVVMRWWMTHRVPDDADIAMYLVALPLGLLMGFVLLRKGFDVLRQRRQAAPAPTAEVAPAATPADPSLDWQLPILAVGVQLPAGDEVVAVREAARAQRRVGLHAGLKNGDGLPVFAAEVSGIDVDAVRKDLPDTAQDWGDAQVRTLALAEALAVRMLDEHFPPHAPAEPYPPRTVLMLEWLLPAGWSDANRQLAQTWLATQLPRHGWPSPAFTLEVHPVVDGAAALRRLDELNCAFHRAPPPPPCLLLASDSHLDEATLGAWQRLRPLHGGGQPEGRIPGEGAAALLLAAPASTPNGELTLLHRVLTAHRDRAVDAPQRLQSDTLLALLKQVRTRAGLTDDTPVLLTSDTDMRSSRTSEAMHFAEQTRPELPATETLLPLGLANGESGAALTLALVAVAAQHVATAGEPALIFSHHDARTRTVALLTPPVATAVPSPAIA